MFGWDFQNSKSDRIKLFVLLLVIFLIVAFTVSAFFRSMNKDEAVAVQQNHGDVDKSGENDFATSLDDQRLLTVEDQINDYDQTEKFSQGDLEKSKKIAVEFATAYHNYNADRPMEYLENAKPYMTEALYEKMNQSVRREVLDRSYLTAKETQVIPVVNKSSLVIRWNVIVKGQAKSVDESILETEDWYLVGLRNVNGEWKVEDVRVNVPN
ncbi:hypothetical protein R4Z10_21430 (plasmid) [Niallia sp. XMNu-256]|uniref:hypothetical protein n=1 Tax=Niallia sp. XMNu-256 TaxID=3082444 RepID=UPI0030D45ECA